MRLNKTLQTKQKCLYTSVNYLQINVFLASSDRERKKVLSFSNKSYWEQTVEYWKKSTFL